VTLTHWQMWFHVIHWCNEFVRLIEVHKCHVICQSGLFIESKDTNIGIGKVVVVGYRWKRDHLLISVMPNPNPLHVNMKSRDF